jgi:hypothetical protein
MEEVRRKKYERRSIAKTKKGEGKSRNEEV